MPRLPSIPGAKKRSGSLGGDGNGGTRVAFAEKSFEKVRRHLARVDGKKSAGKRDQQHRGGSGHADDDSDDEGGDDRIYVIGVGDD